MTETLAEYAKRTGRNRTVRDFAIEEGLLRPDTCTWTPTDEGTDTWATSCDNLFMLSCDTPLAHGMRFCCFCGGALVEGSADEVQP